MATAGLQIARERGELHDIAIALFVLSHNTLSIGQPQQAWTLAEESLVLFRETGDKHHEAESLHLLGHLASVYQAQYDKADQLWLEALSIYREIGDKDGIAGILMNLGVQEQAIRRRFDRAETYLRESLAMRRELRLPDAIRWTLGNLSALFCEQGRLDDAEKVASEGIFVARETNHRPSIITSLSDMVYVKIYQGDYETALELADEAITLVQLTDDPSIGGDVKRVRGIALCAKGDYVAAERAFSAALHSMADSVHVLQAVECVFGLSLVLAFHHQQSERALAIASLVAHHPIVSWWDVDRLAKRLIAHLQQQLPADVYAAAWERGKSLDFDAVVKELLEEFPAT